MAIENHPVYSVIIPTHNRPRLLRGCVASALQQWLAPQDYEILVVDDGSRRPAERVLAREFSASIQVGRLRILRQPQQGWASARRLGAEHSRGHILVFLDDDCRAPVEWLAAYARTYAGHPEADGVGGALRPGRRMNVAGCKQYRGHLAYFRTLNGDAGMHADPDAFGRVSFTFGGNRSFRRALWLQMQPKSPSEGQGWYFDDTSLDLRLRERSACIYYNPEAVVEHHYRLSVTQRMQAAFRYGRSEAGGAVLPTAHAGERLSLAARWQRMHDECPEAHVLARLWYALTQPLAWLARRMGRAAARRKGPHVDQ